MPEHVHADGRTHVGDLTICIGRDDDGAHTYDFIADTTDPIGLTVAFAELVCDFVPQRPDLLLHVAYGCATREHLREIVTRLPARAQDMLRAHLESFKPEAESE